MAAIAKIPSLEIILAHAVSTLRFRLFNFSLDAIQTLKTVTAQLTLLTEDSHVTVNPENSTSPIIQSSLQLETAFVLLLLPTKHKEFAIAVFPITSTNK
jgi:hypothetical protein